MVARATDPVVSQSTENKPDSSLADLSGLSPTPKSPFTGAEYEVAAVGDLVCKNGRVHEALSDSENYDYTREASPPRQCEGSGLIEGLTLPETPENGMLCEGSRRVNYVDGMKQIIDNGNNPEYCPEGRDGKAPLTPEEVTKAAEEARAAREAEEARRARDAEVEERTRPYIIEEETLPPVVE